MRNKIIQSNIITCILILMLAIPLAATEKNIPNKTVNISIDSWLVLGPFPVPLPAFNNDIKRKFSVSDLLVFDEVDISLLKPKAKSELHWHEGNPVQWKNIKAGEKGIVLAGLPNEPSSAYLGFYLDVKRWTRAKLSLRSPQVLRIYLDGKLITTKAKVNKSIKENASFEGEKVTDYLKLETGKHLVIVKTVYDPESNSDWAIQASISFDEKFTSLPPTITLSPDEIMTITHLLDGPKAVGISISPDGTTAALSIKQTLPPSNDTETWIEMYRVSDGCLLQTYRGGTKISRINWAPCGKKFSYTTHDKKHGTIWVVDLEAGSTIPLLKNVKNLGFHVWSPDSCYIIYSVTEIGESDIAGVKRFKNMADRQPQWRDRNFLFRVSTLDGIRQRLTAGKLTTSLNSISPDGKKLIFTRSVIDYSERPYEKTELYSMDFETMEAKLLWKGKWFGNAQCSPDGKKLLILGGPSLFGKTGINVPNNLIPNEYDTQAYLFDLETKKAESITKNFNPSINRGIWSKTENCIYFITTDRSFVHLYKYNLDKKTFEFIDCGVEAIEQFNLAEKKPEAAYIGSSASIPQKAYLIDLQNNKYRLFQDPGKDDFSDVKFGKVERWAFKNKKGIVIEGRVYYPPGFDKNKKYPCIVNYYGGTSPITRNFGGRYPLNLYTAQGCIVYVLQPSGATGFGQEFSAFHVNDWGTIVADEIIYGVNKFLAAHPFVDTTRLGCIGASYGGFMTMYLLTRTNIFSAAVAHAGISSISSYWGEGYWGYSYSAIASANSFPWNRKDIYVRQSPLFNADKIATPLLLLHGSVDTNVPPGESTQLFTALKILGREVEYIQISDQNHHIMTYNKRILWTKTIMAWFDRWLKKQPEWWDDLYPNK